MASNVYLFGPDQDTALSGLPKYFYGLRRNADGDLFLTRANQLSSTEIIEINMPGPPEDDWDGFEYGVDYLDNVDEDHEIQYANAFFSQYRWDNRSMYYYISDDGSLLVRINQIYEYPEGL